VPQLLASIGLFGAIGQGAYLTAAFVLAVHLLARGRRQRDLAPFLLGLQLLLAMGFGYLLCGAGTTLAVLVEDAPRPLVVGLLATGNAATALGLTAAIVFEWRVFAPGARWPRWLGGAFLLAMAVGWAGAAATGAFAGALYHNAWFLLLNAGMLAINLWVGIEPLAYHAKLRRRVALGLAEPLVADRFLLWGVGSLARAVLIVLGAGSGLALPTLASEAREAFTAATLVVASLLGLVAAASYWLTFNPTRAYARWVERRYRRAG
jgi:hypothetical protein